MTQNKIISFILLLNFILFYSCIEKYNPLIEAQDQKKYIISGKVTNQEGYQSVSISLTAPIESTENIPVSNCKLVILDDLGNSFSLTEYKEGKYHVWMDKENLTPGTSFQINVTTPEGTVLTSDYDKMPECPKIDSIYYLTEDPPPYYNDPNFESTEGIQLYIDFEGNENDSRFLRWEIEETWEYHSRFLLSEYVDMHGYHIVDPLDYSRQICWRTQLVKEVFTLSTSNLTHNSYKKFPLNYVTNHSERLEHGYYVVCKQFALSENAFIYWDKMRQNSTEQGGLYEKQPLPVQGNMYNLTNPEQDVLGFFEASSVDSTILFIYKVEGINIDFNSFCSVGEPRRVPRYSTTIVYYTRIQGKLAQIGESCWNCLSRGGINVKPVFWPL